MVFNEDEKLEYKFVGRCPIEELIDDYTKISVLSTVENIQETHGSYKELLEDFFKFYKDYQKYPVLYHMGHVVEVRFFRDAKEYGLIGDFEGAYLWYDTCMFFDDSVHSYVEKNNVKVDEDYIPHNPIYDCLETYRAFRHFIEGT